MPSEPVATLTVVYSRHHTNSGLSSRRSVRSGRSGRSRARSLQLSTRSKGSRKQGLYETHEIHLCYVCNTEFPGLTCETCDTTYDTFWPAASEKTPGIDVELLCDLANANDFPLLQAVVASAFGDIPTIVASFFRRSELDTESSGARFLQVDRDAMATFYDILSGVSSNCPMRAVIHGATIAMRSRPFGPVNKSELAYILALLQCPIFTDCSMFTKLTGPLQKLGRYASFRMPARVLLEKCVGLLANATSEFRDYLATYFAGLDKDDFTALVDLLNGYVAHRLSFLYHQKSGLTTDPTKKNPIAVDWYCLDWRLTATVKVMSILFAANHISRHLPVSAFYNTMVDNIELTNDFDRWFTTTKPGLATGQPEPVFSAWQTQSFCSMPFGERRFYFCRFPFMLSIGAKTRVFDHTVRREIDAAMRKEVFSRLAGRQANFRPPRSNDCELQIRRSHVFEDTVAKIEPLDLVLRLNLRVRFAGEPAIDAGGPRKEWLALFFKELLNPKRRLFVSDESSNFLWFGKGDLAYYTVAGSALGLALRNSVVVDINLPHLLFKRLLNVTCSVADIEQIWPSLAQSIRALLDYEGEDLEEVFGLTFTAFDGTPLLENGEKIAVTSENREEYAALIVASLIETPEYQAFRGGFLKVVGGASLSLYRPEEIDYLLSGDRKPIDVHALQAVTRYTNFGSRSKLLHREPVIKWFWEFFACLDPESQALLLAFITASDRIPAMGIHSMSFRITCLGNDSENLPTAHTCFNQLGIYRYSSRQKFEEKMMLAMKECSGFGIK